MIAHAALRHKNENIISLIQLLDFAVSRVLKARIGKYVTDFVRLFQSTIIIGWIKLHETEFVYAN